jgi:hypothetical protein
LVFLLDRDEPVLQDKSGAEIQSMKKFPAAALKLLGKHADTEIAKKYGFSDYIVRQVRQSYNWTQTRLDFAWSVL